MKLSLGSRSISKNQIRKNEEKKKTLFDNDQLGHLSWHIQQSSMTHFHIKCAHTEHARSSTSLVRSTPHDFEASDSIVLGNCDKISTNYDKCICERACVCVCMCLPSSLADSLARWLANCLHICCWQSCCTSTMLILSSSSCSCKHNFQIENMRSKSMHRTWTSTLCARARAHPLKCIKFAMAEQFYCGLNAYSQMAICIYDERQAGTSSSSSCTHKGP